MPLKLAPGASVCGIVAISGRKTFGVVRRLPQRRRDDLRVVLRVLAGAVDDQREVARLVADRFVTLYETSMWTLSREIQGMSMS